MKLIVGLGNVGIQYDDTRHNIGFFFLDYLCKQWGSSFVKKEKHHSFFVKAEKNSHIVCLSKPTTYMNLSGQAVKQIIDFYKIAVDDVFVLHDDLDLPLGALRLKKGGGSGGHRGLVSIDACLATPMYWRLRLGIGRPLSGQEVSDYVLEPFSLEEKDLWMQRAPDVEKIVDLFLDGRQSEAMNVFHRKD